MSGSSTMRTIAALSWSTIERGVPTGAMMPVPRSRLEARQPRFRNGRHVGCDRAALRRRDGNRPQASCFHLRQRRQNVAEREENVAADHIRDRRRVAFVWHVQKIRFRTRASEARR